MPRRNMARLHRAARRLQEVGWPQHAIARALHLSRATVSRALRGNDIWGGDFSDLIRSAMREA
ncbi:hypothetical protein GCM10019059_07520 [Camelimonas fluminis]|nr:hypothetical protein GCM10019059_07520 [Camelimonas fluminis]